MCLIQLYNVLDNALLGGSFTNPINIPSSAVNYFHLLVVVVPATFTVARILHLTLLPVYEFQNGFLLFEAKKFSYETVMIFTDVAEVQARYFNLFPGEEIREPWTQIAFRSSLLSETFMLIILIYSCSKLGLKVLNRIVRRFKSHHITSRASRAPQMN